MKMLKRMCTIVSNMDFFDRLEIKRRFNDKSLQASTTAEQVNTAPKDLRLQAMLKIYLDEKPLLALRTKAKMKTSLNFIYDGDRDKSVLQITKDFLATKEREARKKGKTLSYINSTFRDFRTVINFYKNRNLLPPYFKYPFGAGGYTISNHFPKKRVSTEEDILTFKNYQPENVTELFSKSVWFLLYRCNEINFADLMRLRWSDRQGDSFVFFRKKTENTTKNHKSQISVLISSSVEETLSVIGNKNSPFVLGKLLKVDYDEQYFENKLHKVRAPINKSLKVISERLNLDPIMQLKTTRDCYATTLLRNGIPIGDIASALGHSNVQTTAHYLGAMSVDRFAEINSVLL